MIVGIAYSSLPRFNSPAANAEGEQNPGNNLHVSGVSNKVTERELDEAFGKFGKVSINLVMSQYSLQIILDADCSST